jgi:hypothetical protein
VYFESRDGKPSPPLRALSAGVYRLHRGQDWGIVIRSSRDGVATIAWMSDAQIEVWPRPGEQSIQVNDAQPTRYGPFRTDAVKSSVLVVVTESTAKESILRALVASRDAREPSDLERHVQRSLWKDGYRWACVAVITVETTDPVAGE